MSHIWLKKTFFGSTIGFCVIAFVFRFGSNGYNSIHLLFCGILNLIIFNQMKILSWYAKWICNVNVLWVMYASKNGWRISVFLSFFHTKFKCITCQVQQKQNDFLKWKEEKNISKQKHNTALLHTCNCKVKQTYAHESTSRICKCKVLLLQRHCHRKKNTPAIAPERLNWREKKM